MMVVTYSRNYRIKGAEVQKESMAFCFVTFYVEYGDLESNAYQESYGFQGR